MLHFSKLRPAAASCSRPLSGAPPDMQSIRGDQLRTSPFSEQTALGSILRTTWNAVAAEALHDPIACGIGLRLSTDYLEFQPRVSPVAN